MDMKKKIATSRSQFVGETHQFLRVHDRTNFYMVWLLNVDLYISFYEAIITAFVVVLIPLA